MLNIQFLIYVVHVVEWMQIGTKKNSQTHTLTRWEYYSGQFGAWVVTIENHTSHSMRIETLNLHLHFYLYT